MKNKLSKNLFTGLIMILSLLFTARAEFAQSGADGLQRITPSVKKSAPNRTALPPKNKSIPAAKKFKLRPVAMTGVSQKSQPATAKYWDSIKQCGDDEDCQLTNYTKIIALDPQNDVAYHNRGIIYTSKENYDAAISDFTKSITLSGSDDVTYVARGIAYSRRQERDKFDIESALADYSKAMQLNPQNAEAYNRRGRLYSVFLGKQDAAIKDLTKAVELKPDYAEAYYNRGIANGKQGNRRLSISDYTKAIAIDPNNSDYYGTRAYAFNDAENYDAAIGDYTKQLSLDPENSRALKDRGEVYIAKGDYNAAIGDFTKAIAADPESAVWGYSLRGRSYSLKGDYANALRDFQTSIELSPDAWYLYLERADSYARQKDYAAAIADATQAISINREFPYHSQVVRGRIYCAQGNYQAAISDFNTALQNKDFSDLDEDKQRAYFERGQCSFKKGDYNSAISDFTKVIELRASYKSSYLQRAAAYRKIGAINLAAADEQRAHELQEAGKTQIENIPILPAAEQIKLINLGVLNGKARTLVKPEYPPSTRADGTVNVQVVVDEAGNVTSAEALTGDPSLRQFAEIAAKASKFYPTMVSGRAVKYTGIIIYNFGKE